MSETSEVNSKKSWLDCFVWQLPVTFLVVTYLTTSVLETMSLVQQHNQLTQTASQLSRADVRKQISDAQLLNQKLNALIREIVALAPTDPNAKRIQDEFNLRYNPPAR